MAKYGVSILKKFLLLLLLGSSLLFSSDLKTEEKIYKLIIHTLLPQKEVIKAWSDTTHNKEVLNTIPNVILVNSPQKADFLLLNNNKVSNPKALIFVTNFKLLGKTQNSALGGFFWQKGRPNILFLRKNLQKHNITLPQSMQEFIEDDL